jgi:hypothetical protein
MFLQAIEALSTIAMLELCGVLRLGAHPSRLRVLRTHALFCLWTPIFGIRSIGSNSCS